MSHAFSPGGFIPSYYTCDGSDISPPLYWKDVPINTRSFVLIMDDPDALPSTWNHWIVYNLPASITALPTNLQQLPKDAQNGKNSWGNTNYGGPCPPKGRHRYVFKLYALDINLPFPSGKTKEEIEKAMMGHILSFAQLVANYQMK